MNNETSNRRLKVAFMAVACSRNNGGTKAAVRLQQRVAVTRSVCLAYQPPASSTFLSEQISHQQPVNSTFLSEQIST
jgi:hypothetical protein